MLTFISLIKEATFLQYLQIQYKSDHSLTILLYTVVENLIFKE